MGDSSAEGAASVEAVELIWVDPKRINLWRAGLPRGARTGAVSVLGGDWDRVAKPFQETDLFQALHERFVLGRAWEETRYYRDKLARIEAGIPLFGCRTEEDFRERLAFVDELYQWIAEFGYKTHRELGPPHQPSDEITVGIGRDGRLIAFSSGRIGGRHRLAIAQLQDVPRVPVRVLVRHEEWVELKQAIAAMAAPLANRVREIIDHPDLFAAF